MSAETLSRAQKLAGLNDAELVDLLFDMLIEEEPKDAWAFIEAKERIGETIRRAASKAASILLAMLGLLGVGNPMSTGVLSETGESASAPALYIMSNYYNSAEKV